MPSRRTCPATGYFQTTEPESGWRAVTAWSVTTRRWPAGSTRVNRTSAASLCRHSVSDWAARAAGPMARPRPAARRRSGVSMAASVVLDAQPEVDDRVLKVALVAEVEVGHGRERPFPAQPHVVSQARDESDPVGRAARAPLIEPEARHPHAAFDEEAAACRGVEVRRGGDVADRFRHAATHVLDPHVHL